MTRAEIIVKLTMIERTLETMTRGSGAARTRVSLRAERDRLFVKLRALDDRIIARALGTGALVDMTYCQECRRFVCVHHVATPKRCADTLASCGVCARTKHAKQGIIE